VGERKWQPRPPLSCPPENIIDLDNTPNNLAPIIRPPVKTRQATYPPARGNTAGYQGVMVGGLDKVHPLERSEE